MKLLITLLILTFFINPLFAQKTNVKVGSWSDPSVWNNNTIPSITDDVSLNFDIIIDVNANCQSLVLNGHNVTVNTGVQFNITGNDTATVLSAFVLLDSTLTTPFDTTIKMLFQYDNKKRNTRIDYTYYDNGVSTNLSYRSNFFYNGNDTVPYKRALTTPLLTAADDDYSNDTSFYFYANGVLTGDSAKVIENGNKVTYARKFAYYTDKIITTIKEYNGSTPNGFIATDTINITYANGNIIQQVDSTQSYIRQEFNFLYDNHINPFYNTQSKIGINNGFPFYEIELHVMDIFTKNNALEINELMGSFYSSHSILTYQYKANGYPRNVLSINDDLGEYYRGVYIYTN
ncbi:MAG: hypothetical protein ABIN67_09960 [Ferruginibacter sp.]